MLLLCSFHSYVFLQTIRAFKVLPVSEPVIPLPCQVLLVIFIEPLKSQQHTFLHRVWSHGKVGGTYPPFQFSATVESEPYLLTVCIFPYSDLFYLQKSLHSPTNILTDI